MNRNKLKTYAPQARRDFIQAVTDRAGYFGLTAKKAEPVTVTGDLAKIGGRPFPKSVAEQRKALDERVAKLGFEQVMEAVAYTWFNRLVAIRFMELHGYFDHGYRVLSHPEGKPTPEIVEHAEHVELPGLDKQQVIDLKLAGNKEEELYRILLIAQCNALHDAMPFLFERINDETELLLPTNLLHSDSLIRTLVNEIEETDWQEVEIIGWLYQFYISEKKDEVIGKVVASEDIPAATQLFTPNWIVKYLVQNTLGRQWLATYPQSSLRQQMEYYIEPAEQTPDVQEQLKAITPTSLNPEELTLLDPACGSGHILVEAYDLFKAIYQERGYRAKDIPALILQKNLFGLEIDDRAAQLSAFALMMKARADDRRIFGSEAKPSILAFQDSKGMDAADIAHALNAPISKVGESRVSQGDITSLLALFENAKTFGSLIQVPPKLAVKLTEIEERLDDVLKHGDLTHTSARTLKPLLKQARVLSKQYDAVVANPPYMGSLFGVLRTFADSFFLGSRPDLFAMFIERGLKLVKPAAYMSMVTMHSWMFLKSFSDLRRLILSTTTMHSMAHLGPRAFPEITGEVVQTTAFALQNLSLSDYRPTFFRLISGDSEAKRKALLRKENRHCRMATHDFTKIPGEPIAFWISPIAVNVFSSCRLLEEVAEPRKGMVTSDNPRFIRGWYEVSLDKIGIGFKTREQARISGKKWFPYQKGGSFRKWYGNNENVINWHNDGHELLHLKDEGYKVGSTNHNLDYIFSPSLVWTKITATPNFRYSPEGYLFDDASGLCPPKEDRLALPILGLLNSSVAPYYLSAFNPTLNLNPGNLVNIPYLDDIEGVSDKIEAVLALAIDDWNDIEISWNFQTLSVIRQKKKTLQLSQECADSQCLVRFAQMKELEEENNRFFIKAYGLEGELSPEVPDDQITLCRPEREEDIKRLLSYAIGCMMGRYSLGRSGLIYAHSGNQGFDESQYETFRADEDGIIPVFETDWAIADDAANRIVEFVGVAWPKEHLEENLKFIADSLGPNSGEQPRDTMRRYLAMAFYKHHLSMYKKRPIYWLFSSGKQRAFQCLVYLHRYNEGTLSRIRTEYVVKLLGKINSRIESLQGPAEQNGQGGEIGSASSTAHRKKLEKERDTLTKQRVELQAYDEKLRHLADQRISLDLDDGVKVNYGKFGDLLAEVKAVTGGSDE